jgi:hypothetical protein
MLWRAREMLAALAGAGVLLGSARAEPAGGWKGLRASGAVAQNAEAYWHTPRLAPGEYEFKLTGTGGDADLYVRIGSPPTPQAFDCRPAKAGSNETCFVRLAEPAVVHVMVRGVAPMSTFKLVGRAR